MTKAGRNSLPASAGGSGDSLRRGGLGDGAGIPSVREPAPCGRGWRRRSFALRSLMLQRPVILSGEHSTPISMAGDTITTGGPKHARYRRHGTGCHSVHRPCLSRPDRRRVLASFPPGHGQRADCCRSGTPRRTAGFSTRRRCRPPRPLTGSARTPSSPPPPTNADASEERRRVSR